MRTSMTPWKRPSWGTTRRRILQCVTPCVTSPPRTRATPKAAGPVSRLRNGLSDTAAFLKWPRRLLLPLVGDDEHRLLRATDEHAHHDGVVVRQLGHRAPRRHLAVQAGALPDHRQR